MESTVEWVHFRTGGLAGRGGEGRRKEKGGGREKREGEERGRGRRQRERAGHVSETI